MNKRLQELYLDAAKHMQMVQQQGLPAPYQTRALAGKFAELILQECIDAIDSARPYHTNDHLVNDYMNGVEHGHKFAITMIRKHFGVEE